MVRWYSLTTMEVFTTTIPRGWEHTDEEHEALETMEQAHRASLPNYTLLKWLEIFPTAKGAAIRGARTRIKAVKNQMSSLGEYREALYNGYVNTAPFKEQPARIAWLDAHIQKWIDTYEKEIKRLTFELHSIENIGKTPLVSTKNVSPEQIAMAKLVPISTLMNVGRNKKTLCPWHDDRDPSLVIKNNRAWCFPCNRGGDVIDLYMVLNRCDMVTAVKALLA